VKRRASIEKANKILGYKPQMDIKTGIKKTYEWIFENRDRIRATATF
jgi:nucleoside-diphosphate-sugar epimerase